MKGVEEEGGGIWERRSGGEDGAGDTLQLFRCWLRSCLRTSSFNSEAGSLGGERRGREEREVGERRGRIDHLDSSLGEGRGERR